MVESASTDDMEAGSPTRNKHPTTSSSDEIDIQIELSRSSKAYVGTKRPIDQKSKSSKRHVGNKHPIESPGEPSSSSEASHSPKKQKPGVENKKAKHYCHRKCSLCKVKVVNLRRHLIAIHSKRKENIPASQVEALTQAAMHGQSHRGSQVQNKNRDGNFRRHQRRKVVCPICQSVTSYLSTHLQNSQAAKTITPHQDAITSRCIEK